MRNNFVAGRETVQRRNTNKGEKMGTPPAPAYNLPGANNVLLKDGTAGDTLIGNYLNYYQLYANWNSNNFSGTDSVKLLALAQLCPHIDGAVIYEARALKQVITDDYSPYANNCDGGGGHARIAQQAITQKYTLFPNPNDGDFVLRQAIRDEAPVSVKVFNTLGALVFATSKTFGSNETNVSMSALVPGFYYIQLQDKTNSRFVLSFIKK